MELLQTRLEKEDEEGVAARAVLQEAARAGVCLRCRLRLLGMNPDMLDDTSRVYHTVYDDESLQKLLVVGEERDDSGSEVCPLCLGILELAELEIMDDGFGARFSQGRQARKAAASRADAEDEDFGGDLSSRIASRVLSRGYDIEEVSVSVVVPLSCDVRDLCFLERISEVIGKRRIGGRPMPTSSGNVRGGLAGGRGRGGRAKVRTTRGEYGHSGVIETKIVPWDVIDVKNAAKVMILHSIKSPLEAAGLSLRTSSDLEIMIAFAHQETLNEPTCAILTAKKLNLVQFSKDTKRAVKRRKARAKKQNEDFPGVEGKKEEDESFVGVAASSSAKKPEEVSFVGVAASSSAPPKKPEEEVSFVGMAASSSAPPKKPEEEVSFVGVAASSSAPPKKPDEEVSFVEMAASSSAPPKKQDEEVSFVEMAASSSAPPKKHERDSTGESSSMQAGEKRGRENEAVTEGGSKRARFELEESASSRHQKDSVPISDLLDAMQLVAPYLPAASMGIEARSEEPRLGLGVPPLPPRTRAAVMLSCTREPLFVKGRYMKLARGISQSQWLGGGNEEEDDEGVQSGLSAAETSVEERISAPLLRLTNAMSARMHSAGREDVDVRMLGRGRPFVLELIDPIRRRVDIQHIHEQVSDESHGKVVISPLEFATKHDVVALGASAQEKQKAYAAICYTQAPQTPKSLAILDTLQPFDISQATPLRVLHRRTLMDRNKKILALRTRFLNPHWFELRLITSAGTYVKEFVHGDLGRTTPSIADLLATHSRTPRQRTDIIQLDVLGIADHTDTTKCDPILLQDIAFSK